MAAVIHILNDDVETADVQLSKGNSPFHKVSLRRAQGFFSKAIFVLCYLVLFCACSSVKVLWPF